MTPRQSSMIRAVLPHIGTIFIAGMAWQAIRSQAKAAVPVPRFEQESLRTDFRFQRIEARDTLVLNTLLDIAKGIQALTDAQRAYRPGPWPGVRKP